MKVVDSHTTIWNGSTWVPVGDTGTLVASSAPGELLFNGQSVFVPGVSKASGMLNNVLYNPSTTESGELLYDVKANAVIVNSVQINDAGTFKLGNKSLDEIVGGVLSNLTSVVSGECQPSGSNEPLVTVSVTQSNGVLTAATVSMNVLSDSDSPESSTVLSMNPLIRVNEMVNYVQGKINAFGNPMNFAGTTTITLDGDRKNVQSVTPITDYTFKKGDIVLDTTAGVEAICTGVSGSTASWEIIGDQNGYAPNSYTNTNLGTATTVHGALDALTNKQESLESTISDIREMFAWCDASGNPEQS